MLKEHLDEGWRISFGFALPVLSSRSKNTKANTTDGSKVWNQHLQLSLFFTLVAIWWSKRNRDGEWVRARDREGWKTRDPLLSKAERTLSFPHRWVGKSWKSKKGFTYLEDGGSAFTLPYHRWVLEFENQNLRSPLQMQAGNIYKSLKAKPTILFTYFINRFFLIELIQKARTFLAFSHWIGKIK